MLIQFVSKKTTTIPRLTKLTPNEDKDCQIMCIQMNMRGMCMTSL